MSVIEPPAVSHSVTLVEPSTRVDARTVMWFLIAMIGCIAVFAPLHHPYWVRGGDGDVYIGMARSIATGGGYRFNGQPVSLVPPLWPYVLAGAMKITTSFAALKLLTISLLMVMLGAWFFILRRITDTRSAAIIVVATAMLSNVHELTFWFHTEPLFCAIFAVALLLAMQVHEGRDGNARIVVIALLCAAMVATRSAGLIIWPVLAAALVSGDWRPRLNRKWATLLISCAVTAITFFAIRWALRITPDQIDSRFDDTLSANYAAVNTAASWEDYVRRLSESGRWMVGLLYPLLNATYSLRALAEILGWLCVVLLFVAGVHSLRTRNWLYAGCALYCGVLFVNWTSPVSRYLVPVAPLLIAAMLTGVERTKEIFIPHIRDRIGRYLPAALVLGIFISGVVVWAVEVRIARSERFAKRVNGGTDRGLVAAAQYLRNAGVKDADVSVSKAQTNYGHTRYTNGWMRAMNVLSGGDVAFRTMQPVRSRAPDKDVMRLLRSQNVKYYLFHTPQRLRMQHYHDKTPLPHPVRRVDDWQLFDVTGPKPALIPLPGDPPWPTHVPMPGDRPTTMPATSPAI